MLVMSEIEARRLLGGQSAIKAKPTSDAKNKKAQELKLRTEVFAQLVGLPKPVSEYVFHPTRKWRLDFAWPEYRLALEIHGGVYSGGRHTRGAGFTEDREKMNEAALLGWTVIEATAEQVRSGKLRGWVERALQRRRIGG
ncbi:Uncharacterised protein [Plesiomonas shigelloides]|uniref:hypothetical protein n=1 Tax=Plesiomonas shigelloides TaxID=703 RepID=UPI000D89AE71|nr:hypothetical protein [Plesiomonas shigelloides]SPZ45894.1 Uncharacterised protein [Plesiomonas shigelloides]